MPKPGAKRICEICGAEIRGEGYTVKVEGAELLVCGRCYSKYGKKKPGTFSIMPSGREPRRRIISRPRPRPQPRRERPLYTEDIVEDYAQRVREARMRSGLSFEELAKRVGISENVLRRIEHGELTPTISMARKLERFFKIQLIEKIEQIHEHKASIPRDYEQTLGDIARIKIKKKKKK